MHHACDYWGIWWKCRPLQCIMLWRFSTNLWKLFWLPFAGKWLRMVGNFRWIQGLALRLPQLHWHTCCPQVPLLCTMTYTAVGLTMTFWHPIIENQNAYMQPFFQIGSKPLNAMYWAKRRVCLPGWVYLKRWALMICLSPKLALSNLQLGFLSGSHSVLVCSSWQTGTCIAVLFVWEEGTRTSWLTDQG